MRRVSECLDVLESLVRSVDGSFKLERKRLSSDLHL